jgi:hypothetical protein
VGFSTEDDNGVELTPLTTIGVLETLPGRYTVDVPAGVTVNWYENGIYIVSEKIEEVATQATVIAIKNKTDQLSFIDGDIKATLDDEQVVVATNNDKTGYALTSDYNAAKTAASQTTADAIKAKTDQIAFDDGKVLATTGPDETQVMRITPETLDVDGAAIGRCAPFAKLLVMNASTSEVYTIVDADADGDFEIYVPLGSLWRIKQMAKRYPPSEVLVSS